MKQQILDELSCFMTEMEENLASCNQQELLKRRVTSRIIKGTLISMLGLLVVNSYFLYQLSTGLHENLRMVDSMAEQFGMVTGSLARMTNSVDVIGMHFESLDSIDADMAEVSTGVATISGSLAGISGTVSGLSSELYLVDHSMGLMDRQVYGMTGNVQQIGGSVHKMAGPMNFMGSMMPW